MVHVCFLNQDLSSLRAGPCQRWQRLLFSQVTGWTLTLEHLRNGSKISAGRESKCHKVYVLFPKGGSQNDLVFMFHGILAKCSFLRPRADPKQEIKRYSSCISYFYYLLFYYVYCLGQCPNLQLFCHLSADIPDGPARQISARHQKMFHDVLRTVFI